MKHSVHYIRTHFLTLEQLSEYTNNSEETILEMIEKKCLPSSSYTVKETIQIESLFGNPEETYVTHYYNPHHTEKIKRIRHLRKSLSYTEIALQLKTEFVAAYKQELLKHQAENWGYEAYIRNGAIIQETADPFILKEWDYLLEGIYGLCTITSDVADIVKKEVLVKKITRLTDDGEKPSLSKEEKEKLTGYIQELNTVQAMFSPHERKKTSRYKWVDRIIERYQLTLN